jgi:hypothetical protein
MRPNAIQYVSEDVIDHLDYMRMQEAASVLGFGTERFAVRVPSGVAFAIPFKEPH